MKKATVFEIRVNEHVKEENLYLPTHLPNNNQIIAHECMCRRMMCWLLLQLLLLLLLQLLCLSHMVRR